MKKERQLEILEEILGAPLPILDDVYYEGAKMYEKVTANPLMTPYVLHEMFTPEELRMVMCLPGTAKEVAKKLNLSEKYVEARLHRLLILGRVLPAKDYFLDSVKEAGYAPFVSPMLYRDRVAQTVYGKGLDWNIQPTLYKLMNKWCIVTEEYDESLTDQCSNMFRIIPKWDSIKTLAGVMDYENMKYIIEENTKNDTFTTIRCVCKQYEHFDKDETYPSDGCASGIIEHSNDDGVCLYFGYRADYYEKLLGGTRHNDLAWAKSRLKEMDDSLLVYATPNRRSVNFICSCCSCCCLPMKYQNMGYNTYIESRFKPEVSKDSCVGCKLCQSRCIFNAISYDENGKCVINEAKCKGCGNCVIKCPTKVLKMKVVHDVDWIPDIYK